MTCQTCIHRLDVTLWGLWLSTGCRMSASNMFDGLLAASDQDS